MVHFRPPAAIPSDLLEEVGVTAINREGLGWTKYVSLPSLCRSKAYQVIESGSGDSCVGRGVEVEVGRGRYMVLVPVLGLRGRLLVTTVSGRLRRWRWRWRY